MYELLSKRIKNADGEPEVFTYNSFPQTFRNQVFIFRRCFSSHIQHIMKICGIFSRKKFCREKGD